MRKKNTGSSFTKTNSKLIKNLPVKCRLLEENIRENICGLGFGDEVLGTTPKTSRRENWT